MGKQTKGTNTKQCTKSKPLVESGDIISQLSDFLLLHILSFLKMPDVIKTSVLSTRWRYLWTSVSRLDFSIEDWKGKTELVTFIDRALFSHNGSKVQELDIAFDYKDTHAILVDAWIRFSIQHNVEVFVLALRTHFVVDVEKWSSGTRYKLPSSLFNCSSIKGLHLKFCDLHLPASVQLCSLKVLCLDCIELSEDMVRRLTTNCPLLEALLLGSCNMHSDLNITIANRNVKSLDIYEPRGCGDATVIEICAPHLHSIGFQFCLARELYVVKDVSSLLTASFSFVSDEFDLNHVYDEDDCEHYLELLVDFCHVKQLRICKYLVQVLSIGEVQKRFGLLPFNGTSLELETALTKWELPGICYLLKCSANLGRLDIKYAAFTMEMMLSGDFKDAFAFEEKEFWESEKFDFTSIFKNLKHVSVYFLSGMEKNDIVAEVMMELENKIEFVGFILKNTKALERMVITCGRNTNSSCTNFELLFKLSEKLHVLPRAAPGARIEFA